MNQRLCRNGFLGALALTLGGAIASCDVRAEHLRLVYLDGSEQYDQHDGFGGGLRCVNGTGDQPLFLLDVRPASDPACSFEQMAQVPVDKKRPPPMEPRPVDPPTVVPPVTSIPEPQTWALMLAGLAVLGVMARRRA